MFKQKLVDNMYAFSKDYPECQKIILDQNYRSSNAILKGANSVIAKNTHREVKNLKGQTPGSMKDVPINEAYYFEDETRYVVNEIKSLIKNHGITLTSKTIIHSDQGAHYTSIRFKEILKENNWLQSMSRRGNCWDNAPQESFYGHMKDEIDISNCKNLEDIKIIIDDYMDYYNNERYQWNLAKLSPKEYYEYLITGIYPLKNDNRNN